MPVNLRYKELTHIFIVASNNVSMSCSNTKKASILLVRKLYTLMQNLGPLPDSISLNMKLAYYEEGKGPAFDHICVLGVFVRLVVSPQSLLRTTSRRASRRLKVTPWCLRKSR